MLKTLQMQYSVENSQPVAMSCYIVFKNSILNSFFLINGMDCRSYDKKKL